MTEQQPVRKLYRSRTDRMLFGICGGIGQYANIDSTLIRVIFVLGTIFSGSILFWAYLVMLLVIPEEPLTPPQA